MSLRINGAIGTQHGRKMISGFVKARDLAELYENGKLKIDEYSITNPDGYQREHSPTRARKFARFVGNKENGIAPTNILVYIREAFDPVINEGVIEIPDKFQLYIVDGQHRTVGFSEVFKMGLMKEDEDYDVPISLMFWSPDKSPKDQKLEEALQFYTINTQAKRPRTDLAHQYIYKLMTDKKGPIGPNTKIPMDVKKKDYVPFEIYVAEQMNSNGPWKNKINPPNGHEEAPMSQGMFTDSLNPVLYYSQNAGLTLGDTVDILNNYWEGVFHLCPKAYTEWDDYLLMKTAGTYSMHIFLPLLITRKRNLESVATKEQFRTVLSELPEHISDSFWHSKTGEASKFGGGKKAFSEIAKDIIDELEVKSS